LVRKAAVLASKGEFQEAEGLAARGVSELMESVAEDRGKDIRTNLGRR